MGYFNIFYKITRIIDMLTRKRNRKFIVALCLIGAIVFFSPNISRADFTSTDSTTLTYMQVDVNAIKTYLQGWITTYMTLIQSNTHTTVERLNDIRGDLANQMTVMSTYATQLANIRQELIDMNATNEHIDDDIHTLLQEVEDTQQQLSDIYDVAQNIESILNSIGEDIEYYGELNHNDQEEIKDLIKEYLYGDNDTFNVVGQSYSRLFFDSGNPIIRITGTGVIWEFQIRKGYTYTFNYTTLIDRDTPLAYVFKDSKIALAEGVDMSSGGQTPIQVFNIPANSSGELVVVGDRDCYIYLNAWNNLILNSAITDYNPGQNEGIYGGLTNIQETTIIQDTQTRETIAQESEATRNTITSTDYNQSDVSINTNSIDNIDTSNTDGLFTTIFTNFNNAARGGVDSISIPMPHNSGNLVLYSNVVSSHLGALASLVSAFWYFVFGFYAFKFVNNLLHSIKNGNILDGFKSSSEVITQDML